MQTQSKCSHVVQIQLQMLRVQAGMEVGFPLSSCNNFHSRVTRTRHSEIILHNAGRRTHLTKIAGAHQGKISGLCWADDHRVLSCGVDRNIKMWDVRAEAISDSPGAGPSQVRFFLLFQLRHFLTLLQPKPLAVFPGKGTLQLAPILSSLCCN